MFGLLFYWTRFLDAYYASDQLNYLVFVYNLLRIIIFRREVPNVILETIKNYISAGAFLASIAGISAFVGFGTTLAAAKKSDPKYFNKGVHGSAELADAGALLALRALGWGTLYAIGGTTCLCYGIWKLSGAKDLKEFRMKMGNLLPVVPKNNPPQSRTEFSGMNDLMTYLSEEYGSKKAQDVIDK